MVAPNLLLRIIFVCGLLLSTNIVNAAHITAHLSRNPVITDESFSLVLEAEGSVDADPDFRALEKDFDILNTSQSTNMTYVNGAFSRKAAWTIILIAKKQGVFTIPSIAFGKDQSPALRVTVKKSTASSRSSDATQAQIFLEVEIDKKSSWIHAQIVYIVRLVRNVNISSAAIYDLETSDPDAIIEQLGDETAHETTRNGIRYVVNERRYAVYPQHSGILTFKPMRFGGRINAGSSRSLFDQFRNNGTLKRIRSKELRIDIKPRPADITSNKWLPTSKIKLTQKWSEPVDKLKVGEPVTRTITISADGLLAAQIPELKISDISGLKQYPDQPVMNNEKKPEGIVGTRQIKVALIPSKNGVFKLPAITIPWWNTRTGKKEVARLPEVILKASGAISAPDNSSTALPPQSDAPLNSDTGSNEPGASATAQSGYWPWISLALAISWAITIILLIRKKSSAAVERKNKKTQAVTNLNPLEARALTSISNNDADKAKDALLIWAKARWPEHNITSLADIAQHSPAQLRDAIEDLNASLYSARRENWEGTKLSTAFELFKSQKADNSRTEQSVLEPLYKV